MKKANPSKFSIPSGHLALKIIIAIFTDMLTMKVSRGISLPAELCISNTGVFKNYFLEVVRPFSFVAILVCFRCIFNSTELWSCVPSQELEMGLKLPPVSKAEMDNKLNLPIQELA